MDNGRSQEGEEENEKRETRMSTTFPTDMIMEILSRLPVKSLLKFRCVSKDWCFLISTPFFITQNLNRLTYHHNYDYVCGGSHGLLHMRVSVNLEYTVTILDIPFKRESDHVKLLGTCNGLLCLFIGKRAYNRPYYRYIHVWNPATKEYNKFSDSFIAPKSTMRRRIVDTVVGLGFDHINNEYKLIKIVYFFEGNRFAGPFQNCVMVCSLKNGQWKNLGNIPYIMKAVKSHAVLNGAIHWMATKGYALNSSSELILSFDLQREVFLEIPQPNYGDGDKECEVTLGECGGFLSLLRLIFNKRVEVWLMKDYGVKESWIKPFNISWSEFDVLEIWKNYGIHDFLWRRNMPRRVWSSLDLKKEGDIRTDCRPWWCCQSFKYVESLVPLRVYQAEDQQQGRGDED